MLGLQKHGKTLFFRDFLHHLKHSTDRLRRRARHPGPRDVRVHAAVVSVRVQGDPRPHRADARTPTRARVKQKYALVKHHDRAGRMTDILEYSNVAIPRERFTDELMAELDGGDPVAARARRRSRHRPARVHRAAARAAQPVHRAAPTTRAKMRAIRDYGDRDQGARGDQHLRRRPAVQELRRHALRPRRVLRLRRDRVPDRLPLPHDPARAGRRRRDVERSLVSGRPARRLSRGVRDVPADRSRRAREAFLAFHADLLDARWWQAMQDANRDGRQIEVLSYPESIRFRRKAARPRYSIA